MEGLHRQHFCWLVTLRIYQDCRMYAATSNIAYTMHIIITRLMSYIAACTIKPSIHMQDYFITFFLPSIARTIDAVRSLMIISLLFYIPAIAAAVVGYFKSSVRYSITTVIVVAIQGIINNCLNTFQNL